MTFLAKKEKWRRGRDGEKNKKIRRDDPPGRLYRFCFFLRFSFSPFLLFVPLPTRSGYVILLFHPFFPRTTTYLIPPIRQGIREWNHGNHTIEPLPCKARRMHNASCLYKKEFSYSLFVHKDITYLKIVLRDKSTRHGFRFMYISKRSHEVCILYLVVSFIE